LSSFSVIIFFLLFFFLLSCFCHLFFCRGRWRRWWEPWWLHGNWRSRYGFATGKGAVTKYL